MKEYIDKQGFKNYISDGFDSMIDVLTANGKGKIAFEVTKSFLKDIEEQPTVTKSDIIEDFVNAYMIQDGIDCSKCDRDDDDDYCCLKCFRDRYLAEMEREG